MPSYSPVKFTEVESKQGFWAQRQQVNRRNTIPAIYNQLKKTGRLAAFKLKAPRGCHIFWDSDVAKWLEAACYSLARHPDPKLASLVEKTVDLVLSAQQKDGYLNTYFIAKEPKMRWKNLRDNHELYCAGHLMEAAAAHFQTTGNRRFVEAMARLADHISSRFGREKGKKRGYCGHEEIELALVKLYRATGEKRFLELSRYFLEERGHKPNYFDQEARARGEDPSTFWAKAEYYQANIPVRQQKKPTGHAVRAMYLYCGMTDLFNETGDKTLLSTLKRLWEHLTQRLMYVTGGIGSSSQNEGFTFDFDLPNENAYAETCATIGLVLWNHRLLQEECDSRYADVLELALYNGVLSGVSLDGKKFFYVNPLSSTGQHHRQDWFGCACCPPNVARAIEFLGEFIYSQSQQEAVVHLFADSTARLEVGGQQVILTQKTNYPWQGKVDITVQPDWPARFTLKIRKPGWSHEARVLLNGKNIKPKMERGYLAIDRKWEPGDKVSLDFPMTVERVYADPRVKSDIGRVALMRGPLVYCLEQADNGPDLETLTIPRKAKIKAVSGAGMVALQGEAIREYSGSGELYRREPGHNRTVRFKAVPYFSWDNRKGGEMIVWVRRENG